MENTLLNDVLDVADLVVLVPTGVAVLVASILTAAAPVQSLDNFAIVVNCAA